MEMYCYNFINFATIAESLQQREPITVGKKIAT